MIDADQTGRTSYKGSKGNLEVFSCAFSAFSWLIVLVSSALICVHPRLVCFDHLARRILTAISAREIDRQQNSDELNRGSSPESSEDRSVTHVVRLAIEPRVHRDAVNQERRDRRPHRARQTGH